MSDELSAESVCICSPVYIGLKESGARNLNPDCPVHGWPCDDIENCVTHMDSGGPMRVGDRVAVSDPGLAQLRAIMAKYGEEVPANNIGVIDEIRGDTAYIIFDDSGQCAPYSLAECTLIDGRGDAEAED